MPRSYGREKLQFVCHFRMFAFTVQWATFIRRCKQLSRKGSQSAVALSEGVTKLLSVRCIISERDEPPTAMNSCTRYPCRPRRHLFQEFRRDTWRPSLASNACLQLQLVLSGDCHALLAAWHVVYFQSHSLLGTTPDRAFQRICNSASTFASRRLLLEPDFEDRYAVCFKGLLQMGSLEHELGSSGVNQP